ncbi:transposase [Nonomuraea rubra]|uniref:transposase n=1 Tax=Nonomuraea rubra TaxID=46180 RepID=UPI00161C888D
MKGVNTPVYGREPRFYPSAASDAERALIEPLLPVPACRTPRDGRPEKHHRRDVCDAIRCIMDNATKWRALPRIPPPSHCVRVHLVAGPGLGSSTGSVTSSVALSGCVRVAAPTRSPALSILNRCAPRPLRPDAHARTMRVRR